MAVLSENIVLFLSQCCLEDIEDIGVHQGPVCLGKALPAGWAERATGTAPGDPWAGDSQAAGIICIIIVSRLRGHRTLQGHSSHLAIPVFIAGWCVATSEASPREKGDSFLP